MELLKGSGSHRCPFSFVTIQPLRRKGTKEKIDMNSKMDKLSGFLLFSICRSSEVNELINFRNLGALEPLCQDTCVVTFFI